MTREQLPRILYVGSVPVEAAMAGSLLIYRLLQDYPKDRLQIIELGNLLSNKEKALPGICYFRFGTGINRLFHSRIAQFSFKILNLLEIFCNRLWRARMQKIALKFEAQAILTVTHKTGWIEASSLAEKLKIPLHLLLHDDLQLENFLPSWTQPIIKKTFINTYKKANTRWCISPYMAESYQELTQVGAEVMYPFGSSNQTPTLSSGGNFKSPGSSLTFAYAGSLIGSYIPNILFLANILDELGYELHIYSSVSSSYFNALGLTKKNIKLQTALSSSKLITRLRDQADVLFVPMSFEPKVLINMQLSFPSKLADYSLVGLPILILGPTSCSAVRFARENNGFAEVIERLNREEILASIRKLANPEYRQKLAEKAIEVGSQYFSYSKSRDYFFKKIS